MYRSSLLNLRQQSELWSGFRPSYPRPGAYVLESTNVVMAGFEFGGTNSAGGVLSTRSSEVGSVTGSADSCWIQRRMLVNHRKRDLCGKCLAQTEPDKTSSMKPADLKQGYFYDDVTLKQHESRVRRQETEEDVFWSRFKLSVLNIL